MVLKTESTTFTKDVLGRWVCNTLAEARDSMDQVRYAGARPFDVIVIGGGSFGSVFAQHVFATDTARRHRVLVLDAGKLAIPEHVQNLPIGFGGVGPPAASSIADLRAIGQDRDPRNEIWGLPWHANQKFPGLAYCLGGRSLFFGGWSPELLDSELAHWPAAVAADLKGSQLAEAAAQIGVSETNDFIYGPLHEELRHRVLLGIQSGQVNDAVALAALPDHWAARGVGNGLMDLARLLGLDAVPLGATEQNLRDELKLEAPLAVQARGTRSGFFPSNKFSSLPLLMEAARTAQAQSGDNDALKRLMVVDDCHVTHLELDGNRVQTIHTQHGELKVPAAAAVVIALGTVESARLALDSTSNPQGLVGRNLMAHLRSNLTLRVPRTSFAALAPELEASALFVKGRHGGRHFHIQVTASGVVGNVADSEAELFKKIPDIDWFDAHKLMTDNHVVVTLRVIGEMEGDTTGAGSRVELDPETDEYGRRRAKVTLGTSQTDLGLWAAMDQAALELADVIGGADTVEYLVPNSSPPQWSALPPPSTPSSQGGVRDGLGTTHHEAGTLWMGTNPTTSVTDVLGRFHDVPNLYATGPCLFPTVGSPNPMLTGVALARRTAEAVVSQAAPNSDAGFATLFDGRSLAGWSMVGQGRFLVAGGTLETEGGPGLLWYSASQFADVELRLEWLATHDSDNSGIFLRFANPGADPHGPGSSGYEVQIDELGAPHGDPLTQTGAIYSFSPPLAQAAHPAGSWNQYQVAVVGQKYTVRLNGTVVNRFTGNRALTGFVGLQNHNQGARVLFRNIQAKAL